MKIVADLADVRRDVVVAPGRTLQHVKPFTPSFNGKASLGAYINQIAATYT